LPEYAVFPVPPLVAPRVPVTCVPKFSEPEIVESVVVATQLGMPLARVSTNPFVVDATRASVEAVWAYRMSPGVYEAMPVPPLPTGSVPVTCEVRLT